MTDTEIAIQWLKENLPSLEDYGEMIGAPPQYCGIKYVYNDPCGYVFETAIEVLEEKLEREKGCEYCDSIELQNSSGRVFYKELPHHTEIITTLDDAHLQIAFDDKSGWVLHFEDENGDRMFDIKINDCPMCGRKLNNAPTDEH